MNPNGMKGWEVYEYEYDNKRDYYRSDLYIEYTLTNYYDESFEDWYKWKRKRVKAENKRRTVQLRRKLLLHKILNEGYMAVNYVK